MARILVVGEDQWLLQTRAAVLEKIGAETVACAPHHAAVNGEIGQVDVLVVCHSIEYEKRRTFIDESRKRWPGVRVLQVLKSAFSRHAAAQDADAAVFAGEPGELQARVRELLNQRKATA